MFSQTERPFHLDDIVGHKLIVHEMKEHSKKLTFPPVMLFKGVTGTGKTTMARLVSAIIADKNPIVSEDGVRNPNPESPVCQTILNETYSGNVKYFDCSVVSKDGVRDLKQSLATRTIGGGNKCYILDEFQELNSHSRGAVLNLLEKPYKNTTLILTTMNPEKIDQAILSRCVPYDFKSPSEDDLAEYLYNTTLKTGVQTPDSFIEDGLYTIADNSNGSIRLAMQYLQRCLDSKLFTEETICSELGLISKKTLDDLCSRLFVQRDYKTIFELKKYDASTVYYRARSILLNAHLYKYTNKAVHSWQKGLYEKLKNAPLEDLVRAFVVCESNGRINEAQLYFEVISALEKTPVMVTRRAV